MQMFTGRKKELAYLRSFAEGVGDGQRMLWFKGRKGMGKTALVREFVKDRPSVFLTAYPTTDTEELRLLAAELGMTGASSLSDILDEITRRAGDGGFILVIDNYPAFARADASFEKTLCDYVSMKWAGTGIGVIALGDSFLAMDKLMAGSTSVRWGKVLAGSLTLAALGFYEAREFFPEYAPDDQAFLCGLAGGIPARLARLRDGLTEKSGEAMQKEAIRLLFFGTEAEGILPEDILDIDLREKSYYNRMLATLASGRTRVNEISAAVGKPKDVVVPYMNTLISLSLVAKEYPVTEPFNRRKTRYVIVNSHDIFYYRYIVPHMDLVFSGKTEELIERYILPDISSFTELIFGRLCREFVGAGGAALPVNVKAVGTWWENDDENHTSEGFDLVAAAEAEEEKEALVFGRCFFDSRPVDMPRLKGLIDLTKKVREKADETYYIAFSNSGFHDTAVTAAGAIRNILLISLDEIVAYQG